MLSSHFSTYNRCTILLDTVIPFSFLTSQLNHSLTNIIFPSRMSCDQPLCLRLPLVSLLVYFCLFICQSNSRSISLFKFFSFSDYIHLFHYLSPQRIPRYLFLFKKPTLAHIEFHVLSAYPIHQQQVHC